MGFCYGGPYAIIAPARLGYDAGMSCHGTAMLALVGEAAALRRPLCVLWGDEDRMAPPKVRQRYLEAQRRSANLTVRIFPGVKHGYMMRASAAFDAPARDASFEVALRMLRQLELGDRSSPAAGTP
jgi:carboxymethylenebutenolidase